MAKRKKIIRAGNLVMASIYTAPQPRDPEHVRAAKSKMTTAARRCMNMKISKKRLEMVLAANFTPHDLHATFTYRDENLPSGRKDALKCVRKFLGQLRQHRHARGQELKYIYVTEGKHGDKRLHHHVVINATDNDIELLRSLWVYGDQIDIEYIADREYQSLAEYITKESMDGKPNGAQMWTGSKNLEKPIVESCFVDDCETLSPPAGCFVLERREEQNEFGSFAYIKYRIADIQPRKTRPSRSRKTQQFNTLLSGLNPCITLDMESEKRL